MVWGCGRWTLYTGGAGGGGRGHLTNLNGAASPQGPICSDLAGSLLIDSQEERIVIELVRVRTLLIVKPMVDNLLHQMIITLLGISQVFLLQIDGHLRVGHFRRVS
uniref:Uncharacterized protein n=1 Tax=Cacopsylla melanoneura TaxID=428564 RepID=A0A8D8MAJ3_9HEMI